MSEDLELKQKRIQNMQKELEEGDFRGKSFKKKEIEAKIAALKKEMEKEKQEKTDRNYGFVFLKEKIKEATTVKQIVALIPFARKTFGEEIVNKDALANDDVIIWRHISLEGITNLALLKINDIQAEVIRKSKEVRVLTWIKMTLEEAKEAEEKGILAGYDPDEGLGAVKT